MLNKAMEFEKKSMGLYSNLSEKTDSKEVKDFYNELSLQERAHMDYIRKVGFALI